MAPLKRDIHRAKPSTAEPLAVDWWVKDFRIFVPVHEHSGTNDVVEKRLPLSLRKALQQYAQELSLKVRGGAAKKFAKEQVGKRGSRRKGRSHNAPGLMDVILSGRCLSK